MVYTGTEGLGQESAADVNVNVDDPSRGGERWREVGTISLVVGVKFRVEMTM